MTELEPAVHFDRMNKVVEELLKGNTPTQIATSTGFKRAEVIELIDEWKQVVHNDVSLRGRAKEAISGADQHYAMLIKEAWKTVEDADTQGQLSVKVGVLESNEIASQIAETERKQEILVGILKEVTATCPKCKLDVAKRLSQITGIVESVVVEESDVV
jgi:hypothetical protein